MVPTRTLWVSPLERLYALQRELDRTFTNDTNGQNGWVPAMDVVETPDEIRCQLEVPGLAPEAIEIRVQDNLLMIAGEKKQASESTVENGGFRSIERHYGRFERSFTLPRTVDTSNVKAQHEHGVLTVRLPKMEASKPRRIQIEGASPARELKQ
jgi:HSP20 family protein